MFVACCEEKVLTGTGDQGDVASVFVPHQVAHCDSFEMEMKVAEKAGLLKTLRRLGPRLVREEEGLNGREGALLLF